MSYRYRFMRLMVFFDLPVKTAKDKRNYRLFRKFLLKQGYIMIQESVYVKLTTNEANAAAAIKKLQENKPPAGLVQVLKVTEKQFASMTYITGSREPYDEVDTMEDFIVI